MPTKRTAESEEDDYSVKDESDYTPPSTPKPKLNTKKPKATPSPTKSTTSSSNYIGDKSPKAIFGEMIILAGIKNLSKAEIYAAVSRVLVYDTA
jgi:hypothetical protein